MLTFVKCVFIPTNKCVVPSSYAKQKLSHIIDRDLERSAKGFEIPFIFIRQMFLFVALTLSVTK